VVVRKSSPLLPIAVVLHLAIPRALSYQLCPVGHINHSLFWRNLAPSATEKKGNGGVLREGPLRKAIIERWGSLEAFQKEFNTTTAGIQGSGWGWLVRSDA
jgi:superoxide dismutase